MFSPDSACWQARDVCLFVGKMPGNRPHLVCKVENVVDIDVRQVTEGCLGLRISAPPVQIMIYNTRALVLEDFVRLLRKLTERRKTGTAVRFKNTPEQVLESQRIERETMTNVSANSAMLPASVANALGGLYMQASASHAAAPNNLATRASPGGTAAQPTSADAPPSQPLKAALDVRQPLLWIHMLCFLNCSLNSSSDCSLNSSSDCVLTSGEHAVCLALQCH